MKRAAGFKLGLASALLALGTLTAGAAAAQTTINGALTASDPVWDRYAASDTTPCAWDSDETQRYYYDVYPITHGGGTLTVEMKGEDSDSGTLSDPYIYLFSGTFNPAQPCPNLVAEDDDDGDGWDAKIEADLPAGNYVIVATTYDNFQDEDDGYGLGTYQLIHSARPQQASAVTPVPTLGELTLAALSLVLAGGGAVALRRRRRHQD